MSYDIAIFDPAAVDDEGFPAWYEAQIRWEEDHGYDDPAVTTPALRHFLELLAPSFPALNPVGDLPTVGDEDGWPRGTGYSVGRRIVYAAFAWSLAREARDATLAAAAQAGVAVALVSDGDTVVRP